MKHANLTLQRLAWLGLLGAVLLTFPILSLPVGECFGLPAGFVYLFGVWACLIGAAALIAQGKRR